LFSDRGLQVGSPTVRPFEPAFALWSDGVTKRRWIELPPGARIDATNTGDWIFPQGTKLWKEFSAARSRPGASA
jgi:hypothetical protein